MIFLDDEYHMVCELGSMIGVEFDLREKIDEKIVLDGVCIGNNDRYGESCCVCSIELWGVSKEN